jgi:hypothetical protein
MSRLAVTVSHTYSAKRPAPKLGPTGRPIRDMEGLVPGSQAREALIGPRFLAWVALLILLAGSALALAWWRVNHFPH